MKNCLSLMARLIVRSDYMSPTKTLRNVLSMLTLISVLFAFAIMLKVFLHPHTVAYSQTTFDYKIQGFSANQIAEIKALKFVEEVFPVRILSGEVSAGKSGFAVEMFAADSFEGRNISYFSNRLLIRKSSRIMSDQEANPIVIDRRLARALKVGLGDTVYIPFGREKTKVLFTVAAISEDIRPRHTALFLWRGAQRELFIDSFGDEGPHSYMFVKVNDRDKAFSYFRQDFIPEWYISVYGPFPSEEDRLRHNAQSLSDRLFTLRGLTYELRFAPTVTIALTSLGFLVYFFVLYRETDKKVEQLQKDFSILYALGMPKIWFITYLSLDAALFQLPVFLIATGVVRYGIYNLLLNMYIPSYLMAEFITIGLSLLIISLIVNSLVVHVKLAKKNFTTMLVKE